MIEVAGAHVVYGEGTPLRNHALRGVDVTVPEGQFATLIGSNGSGKSTLFRVISGEVALRSGSVSLAGRDVTALPQHLRARDLAVVAQDPLAGTCADLTIAENMSLAMMRGQRRALSRAVSARRKENFSERLSSLEMGLEDRMDDQVGSLSGGQRQALSLVMTTLAPCKVLLLDEHTAALDPRMSTFVLELTERIYERFGLTVLMVTHSMRQALSVGTRTVMMHLGEVVLDLEGDERKGTTPAELFERFYAHHAGAGSEGAHLGGEI